MAIDPATLRAIARLDRGRAEQPDGSTDLPGRLERLAVDRSLLQLASDLDTVALFLDNGEAATVPN
jgi:hypothetical protein